MKLNFNGELLSDDVTVENFAENFKFHHCFCILFFWSAHLGTYERTPVQQNVDRIIPYNIVKTVGQISCLQIMMLLSVFHLNYFVFLVEPRIQSERRTMWRMQSRIDKNQRNNHKPLSITTASQLC